MLLDPDPYQVPTDQEFKTSAFSCNTYKYNHTSKSNQEEFILLKTDRSIGFSLKSITSRWINHPWTDYWSVTRALLHLHQASDPTPGHGHGDGKVCLRVEWMARRFAEIEPDQSGRRAS